MEEKAISLMESLNSTKFIESDINYLSVILDEKIAEVENAVKKTKFILKIKNAMGEDMDMKIMDISGEIKNIKDTGEAVEQFHKTSQEHLDNLLKLKEKLIIIEKVFQ
jgi:uncharacterized protein YoxC